MTWLGLSNFDELTDEDCLAWSKAAGRVNVAEAQRWSDYGLPFTMIPLARQMGVRLPQVADVVALLRDAGIDPGCPGIWTRCCTTVIRSTGVSTCTGSCSQPQEFGKALAGEVARAAMRGIYSPFGPMTEAYVELAYRHFGDQWCHVAGRRRPHLPAAVY